MLNRERGTQPRPLEENEREMQRAKDILLQMRIWKDTRGQDLIEYALMAGFVAVAAGAIMPGVSTNISKVFSKISVSMSNSANQG